LKSLFFSLLGLILAASFAQAATPAKEKEAKRKPNQSQEFYFQCTFAKKGEPPIYALAVRTPVSEDEIGYRESNRATVLKINVNRSGVVSFQLTDGMSERLITKAKKQVDLSQSFFISGRDASGEWVLDCKN
jgi:hypothetical protein